MLKVDFRKRLGDFLLDVRFSSEPGILVLFGPSGAGKTQTLDAIAGVSEPDEGEIVVGDTVFFRRAAGGSRLSLPPRERRAGYVVQQYALFPHMTALQNVAYGLPQSSAPDTAMQLLRRLRIAELADRFPSALSGGEQQRVAIARALAIEPRILLLDEPFAALDAAVRSELHTLIRELQQERNLVVVYVTHNLSDAFAIGTRLAVIDGGVIQQTGDFDEVTSRPATDAVLRVLGVQNPISARVLEAGESSLLIDWEGMRLEALPADHAAGEQVRGYLRGEDVKVIHPDRPRREPLEKNNVAARLVEMQRGAWYNTLRFVLLQNGQQIEISAVRESHAGHLRPGDEVTLAIKPKAIVVF
jgi:molybdate transport system ATP-binding protein